jgi:hypothetical protein
VPVDLEREEDVSGKLDDANQKLADAKQAWKDYAAGVKAGVVAFADITQLGKNSAGNASADGIVSGLKQRAAAVQRYVATVRDLIGKHLNATALQQILDKGVDGGLQTALAIEQGGAGTIAQINALQAQIDKAAGSLGSAASHRMNDAGVAAAQGLVNGLVARQADLDRVATRLANALVKAVKKKLGIKSPSRVFQELGRNTVEGLNLGLDDKYVRRSGEILASSLVKGFGQPGLSTKSMTSPSLLASQQASTQTLRVTLSAPERDALLRGRDVTLDIAAASSVGARQLS